MREGKFRLIQAGNTKDVRWMMDEQLNGRGKKEEGRNSNAHYNPNYSTLFQLLYLMFVS